MQVEELEGNSETSTCADKDKQTSIAYDIKGGGNTSSTSEKKEKARDGYVCIYECGKQFCTSTLKCACAVKEMLESFNYERKELHTANQYLQNLYWWC